MRLLLSALLGIVMVCIVTSCEKEPDEILPTINVKMYERSLLGEQTLLDSLKTHIAVTASKGDLTIITGTKIKTNDPEGYMGQKLIFYLKDVEPGKYKIEIDFQALLGLNIKNIVNQVIVYQDKDGNSYLLMDGSFEIIEKEKNSIKGTFSGKVIPADLLDGNIDFAKLTELLTSRKTIEGDFNVYGLLF
ncbi:MAG: hypothetical protein LBH92_05345 [Bacteroidales bacterium]|nr:hypothetical protein [Bacteroidales bacterium]